MKNSGFVVLMGVLVGMAAAPAAAADAPEAAIVAKGRMLRASDGARLGSVYRVVKDGSAEIILDGKLVTVPASTISVVEGKLVTSLTKKEVTKLN